MIESEYVRPEKLAVTLGVSSGTLSNWRVKGGGPKFTKLGGRVVYSLEEVEKWLKKNTRRKTIKR